LELDDDPVRIAEIELRRPFLCTAISFAAHSHPHLHRIANRATPTGAGNVAPGHAVFCEHLNDPVEIEALDVHAEVVDAWFRPALTEAYVLRSGPKQETNRRTLAMVNRQAEQALIELQRALLV
jgi:hypothetical protein